MAHRPVKQRETDGKQDTAEDDRAPFRHGDVQQETEALKMLAKRHKISIPEYEQGVISDYRLELQTPNDSTWAVLPELQQFISAKSSAQIVDKYVPKHYFVVGIRVSCGCSCFELVDYFVTSR